MLLPPFPDLIDLMLFGQSPAQLAPALRLATALLLAGIELPHQSYQNLIDLLSHVNQKVSDAAYKSLAILIQRSPVVRHKLIKRGFLERVKGVMEFNPRDIKRRAADLLCLLLENGDLEVVEEVIASEMMTVFLEILQMEEIDLQKRL
ncbi:MAG: hypothetical protein LBS84_04835, partial [Clostridiales bacterium]|nr:hypothetical protein [Clostridiales bacterium]